MFLPPSRELWLYLLLLMALWLWLRVDFRKREPAPRRRMPMTPDELGHVLFEVARGGDLHAYRGLFISGPEVRKVLAADAPAYLEKRTDRVVAQSLVDIGSRIPAGSRYAGFEVGSDGHGMLRVHPAEGDEYGIPVGTVVKVGPVLRLRDWLQAG
jgi:hypothetical protein